MDSVFWETQPDPINLDIGWLASCDPGADCESYDFDPATEILTVSAAQPFAGEQYVAADYRDGWHHIIGTGNGATLVSPSDIHSVLLDAQVLSFDADWRDTTGDLVEDTLYIVAVIDRGNGNEVVLRHGDPKVALTEIEIPFEDDTRPA